MATIFIVGYMGCGKTTFGRALAKRLEMQFIDLDFYIEQRFRTRISDIFAKDGEEAFRDIESRMLREAGEFDNTIVACGGGTPCFASNMEYMKSRGITVWLEADIQCLVRRIIQGGAKRPITRTIPPEELPMFVKNHLESRIPFYSQAQIYFSGEQLEDARQINSSVEAFIKKLEIGN